MQLDPLVGAVGFEVDVSSLKQGEEAALSFAQATDTLGEALAGLSSGVSGTGAAFQGIASGASAASQGLESTASAGASASAAYSGVAGQAGSAGSALSGVGGQANAASAGVGELAEATADTAVGLSEVAEAAAAAEDGLKGLGDEADKAGQGVGKVTGFTDKAKAGVLALNDGLGKAGLAAQGIEKMKAPIAGVVSALGEAVGAASEYDQAVTAISTLGSEAASMQDEFKSKILEVSQALGQDAVGSAKAAYDAISSGVQAGDAIAFLETSARAATAGLSTTDTAGKALTVTLNSFNLKASETNSVSDALFAAANVGVTTFDELASSFGGVASIAAASGAGYKETLASLAQITTKGASTSQAVTQLKATFTALSKPNPAIAEELSKQGFASAQAAIEAKGFQYVLELVRQTADDTGKPLIELLGSTEAVNAVLATTGANADGAREKVAALGDSAGSTQAAFDLFNETPAQKMNVFGASVQAAKIALGDALLPVLGTVLDAVSPLVQGFTSFAQNVLLPLGQGFAALPTPITTVVIALAGLAAGAVTLIGGLAGVSAIVAPVIGIFTGGGVAATIFTGGLAGMGTAASAAGAAVMGALGPIGLVIGVLGVLYTSVGKANEALDGQFGALDKSSAGFDDYAAAVARAKEESGLLANIGIQVKGSMAALGDEVTEANHGYAMAGEALGLLWNHMTGGDEATKVAEEGLSNVALAASLSANEIILAGQAWLEQGTNIQPAVLASDEFSLAQARLNNDLRDGSITQDEYKTQLLETANATSQALGAGSVLTAQQQTLAAAFTDSLGAIAANAAGISDANLASEGLAAKQAELANEVAGGTLSTQQATEAFNAYLTELAASDTATLNAISANADLASGYQELLAGLQAGTVSYQEASAGVFALGEAAGATEEQMTRMNDTLQGAAISPDLAGFGVSLDFETLADPEKFDKEMAEIRNTSREAIHELFAEQLNAREQFASDEQAIINERGPALQKAEADILAKIKEAQDAGKGERVAELQAGMAEELNAIGVANDQKLQTLRDGYAAERADRLNAIAQAALDQVNSMLSLGQISEQQAQIIFGSLQQAAPNSALFDEAAAASLEFSGQLGQALGGNVEAAVGLGGALLNIDTALTESQNKAGEYEAKSVAAFQNAAGAMGVTVEAGAEVALTYDGINAAATTSADGSVGAADLEVEANMRRLESGMQLTESTDTNAVQITAAHGVMGASAVALADTDTAEAQRRLDALVSAGQITEAEYAKMSAAIQASASTSSSATGDMVGDTQRLRSEATTTGGVVDQNVRGIGTAYTGAAAGVREGSQGIVVETAKANVALGGLGAGVPTQLAPAADSVAALRGGVQLLAEDVDSAAQQRASADEGAARAATGAAEDTVGGFEKVQRQGVDTREEIDNLRGSMEKLPKKIEIPLTTQGIKETSAALDELIADLKALQTAATIRIYGEYIPKNGPMKPDQSLRLQHDIEDAISAAEPGVNLDGTYAGVGGMAWGDGSLALADAIQSVYDQTNTPFVLRGVLDVGEDFRRLLFDPDFEAASLATALAQIAALEAALDEATATAERARGVLPAALQGITAALDNFFTLDPAQGGLALLLQQFQLLAEQVKDPALAEFGEQFFVSAGILDVSSFDEFRAQLASLSDEPKRQEELWNAFIDALENRWKVYYERESNNLERQKRSIKAALDAEIERQKLAGVENPEAPELEAQLDAVDQKLQSLKNQNEDINLALKEQTFNVQAQYDLYGRLAGTVEDLEKQQREAAKALADYIKEQEGLLKERQRASTDAEKSAHEQTMDLLDDEMKARDKAYKAEIARLDGIRKRTEDDIAAKIAAEKIASDERLKAITAGVDALDATNDAEEQRLKRAKLLIDTMKAGNTISTTDADFLRSLGIDPDKVLQANAGLDATKAAIDAAKKSLDTLKALLGKLPAGPGRVRLTGGVVEREFGRTPEDRKVADLGQEERDALQKGIDDGTLTGSAKRLAEIALAGGVVQGEKLRKILESLIKPLETEVTAGEKQVALAGQHVDLAGQLLSKRETALKVLQDDAKTMREGLAQQIADEKTLFKNFEEAQKGRLVGIDAQKASVKLAHETFKDAIAEAKAAEQDRHEARMQQIAAEYALELLRLGHTEAEVQRILNEQAAAAAKIAAEAQERFKKILADAGATINPPPPPTNPFGPPATPPPGIDPPIQPPAAFGLGGVTDSTDGELAGVGAAIGIDALTTALARATDQWEMWTGGPVVLTAAQTAAVAASASTTINNRTLQNSGPIMKEGLPAEVWEALCDFLGVAP